MQGKQARDTFDVGSDVSINSIPLGDVNILFLQIEHLLKTQSIGVSGAAGCSMYGMHGINNV